MKTMLLSIGVILGTAQLALAGGNSSIVEITVKSIKIEEEKVTIKGSGMLRKRVMSDAEHGDARCFGQPAQMLYAKVDDATFEVVPYHVGEDIKGVPSGPLTEEGIAQCKEWWKGTLEDARQIKVGDKLQIGYQRERLTIIGVRVTHVVGSGSLTIQKDEPAE